LIAGRFIKQRDNSDLGKNLLKNLASPRDAFLTALGGTDGERSATLVAAAEGKRLTCKQPESVS
jgi:hypothetical protein